MESRLINSATNQTVKTIQNPIRWLFNHADEVTRFEAKILQHGGTLLIAHMDARKYTTGNMFRMTWADHSVFMDRVFRSRAWSNHFFQTEVTMLNSHGQEIHTRIIK